jgi:hypothetical protein
MQLNVQVWYKQTEVAWKIKTPVLKNLLILLNNN